MKNLQQLIKSLRFNYVNDNINVKNFPDTGRRSKDIKLYKFDKTMTSEEVIKEAEKDGYEPANAYELLEWAKNWNGKDYVVALGQQWKDSSGNPGVLVLGEVGVRRGLGLYWFDGGWLSLYVFVFVRKQDSGKLGKKALGDLESRIKELELFKEKVEKVLKI